jgi:uncharacterized protein YjbJ (UPF0337 family)
MAWKNHALRDAWLVVRCALAAPEEDRKDQIKGKHHEIKDKAKEKAGQVTNNPDLAAEGQAEKNRRRSSKKVGQIEKVLEVSRPGTAPCAFLRVDGLWPV